MKSIYLSILCLIIMSSCKSDKKQHPTPKEETLTVAEKIANAHGYKNWKNVSEIQFTFKVDRDTLKGKGRSWTWHPKTDQVKMSIADRTFNYLRSDIDSIHIAADRSFINDKFWLLVPFQLVWDTTAKISEPQRILAPISKDSLDMITITYPNEGGYTPGDAYDIYYDESYIIKEWVFRQGNSKTPSLTTTFENYKDYNGIKIATDHKQGDVNWNLNFANIKVTLD